MAPSFGKSKFVLEIGMKFVKCLLAIALLCLGVSSFAQVQPQHQYEQHRHHQRPITIIVPVAPQVPQYGPWQPQLPPVMNYLPYWQYTYPYQQPNILFPPQYYCGPIRIGTDQYGRPTPYINCG